MDMQINNTHTDVQVGDIIKFGHMGLKERGIVTEVNNGKRCMVTLRVKTYGNSRGYYDQTFTLRKDGSFVAMGWAMDEGKRFANPTPAPAEAPAAKSAVSASVEMAEKALKNARVMAETAFGMAKFNLESVEGELRTAEALALCDQTIANIKERIGIAERELEAARDVIQSIRRAHINVKTTMGYGDLQGLQGCLEADAQ